jgi:hypothetical protein
MVDAMVFFGDLQTIAFKLITFGKLKYHNAPYMIGVHCMNHHTNLAV